MAEQSENILKRVELIGLIATAIPLAIATFNVLTLVEYDTTVLPVIVRHLDIVSVAFSVFLNSFPFLPLALAVYLANPDVDLGALIPGLHLVALLALMLATILFLPLSAVLLMILFFFQSIAAVVLISRTRKMVKKGTLDGGHMVWRWFMHPSAALVARASGGIILGVSVLFASFSDAAQWMALERIEAKNETYVGWVLQAGDHDLILLEEHTRKPFILRQDDVLRRTICQGLKKSASRDVLSRTVPSLIFDGMNLPARLPNCQ